MALFGKKDKGAPARPAQAGQQPQGQTGTPEARRTAPVTAHCRVCGEDRGFSKCWVRLMELRRCPCCGAVFENPAALYRKNMPACPTCGEFLEHPGFQYGVCDGCGSKYELMPGTRPSLLPNKTQRDEMNSVGKSWSRD